MKAIHAAVIGAGAFGRHHVRHLSQHPAIQRVSVVDRSMDRACALAEIHNATPMAELGDITPDIAVVAVPTEYHRAVAEPLLRAGVPLLIEKPIAGSDADAAALVALAAENNVPLLVGHIERHGVVFSTLNKQVDTARYVAARRLNPPRDVAPTVDVVLDLMIHDIDLALTLIGAPVTAVEAMAHPPHPTETVTARLIFADGAVADLAASRLSPITERTLIVHDSTRVWRADLVNGTLDAAGIGAPEPIKLPAAHDNLRAELDDLIAAALTGRRPRVSGQDGAAALAIANEIKGAIASSTALSA